MPSQLRDVVSSLTGSVLVLAALVIIWIDRLSVGRDVYVSELGSTGAPTARSFEVALLLIVAGGTLIGFAGRDVRSRLRVLALWTPAVSLWIASGFFLVASQVTCTAGCPVPYGPSFDWQDLTHVFCATAAFIVACWGMLQTSFADGHRVLARFSLAMGIAVGVVAAVGGILSLANFETAFGSRLELVATTLAILWVAVYGAVIAARRIRDQRAEALPPEIGAPDISSSSRLASPTST
jgi:heme A synthase